MTTHALHTPRHETSRGTSRPESLYASWRDRSACLDYPAQWWDHDAPKALQDRARAVCLKCPVFAECLADALVKGSSDIRAGLAGKELGWLRQQVRLHGDADAEEARLLALEATVSGRPVKEIAGREGVGGVTRRLAVKLLPAEEEESAEPGAAVKPPSRRDEVLARIEEVLEWRSGGASLVEVAARLGVTTHLASEVIKAYLGQDPDQPLTVRGRLSKAERADQIIDLRQSGLTWKDIDAHLKKAAGTTYRFVSRYRTALEAQGEEVPREFQREQVPLTEEQVVRIRERAAEGVTDLEQAMELGVYRQVVSDVASGETYRKYGGPIRAKRAVKQPCLASRTLVHNGQAGFAKAS